MTRRDDLEKTIKDLQKALHEAQEELDNLSKFERFVPKRNERYYIVNGFCTIDLIENNMTPFDNNCINCYNCFKTKEEARKEADKIIIRRKLEDIARRLNGGRELDWTNNKNKFYITYSAHENALHFAKTMNLQIQGVVYCISPKILTVAIEEIGEERLIDYIKGE